MSISHLGGEIYLALSGEVEAGGILEVITIEIAFRQLDRMQLPREWSRQKRKKKKKKSKD